MDLDFWGLDMKSQSNRAILHKTQQFKKKFPTGVWGGI